ncbi:hypothetical protein FIU97_19405 (plasmid) [Roseivivax sp. THAF40]|uniref:hypothetical protein n=1 Tax=unclassified Roseivivax TaxID=2639302 RepID=UPI001267A956|nr:MULTISPECIES: hypothetical protein [unclassified Roseivivax]QFS84861.1 hypothetical protein FIV09_18620 [Roseivivax sp. THAF197b]QFT48763.1 hypothetical protein FIU97_19405 [Roseivivax sp. THAF40]
MSTYIDNIIKPDFGDPKESRSPKSVNSAAVQCTPAAVRHNVISDPIEEALNMISGHFLEDWFRSDRLISVILTEMAKAATELYEYETSGEKLFFETYFRHSAQFENIIANPNFIHLKVKAEGYWLGAKKPSPFLLNMDTEDITFTVVELFKDWRKCTGASRAEMIQQLAIQKVAIATLIATSGEERSFLDNGYRATRYDMEYDLGYEEIERIHEKFFPEKGLD